MAGFDGNGVMISIVGSIRHFIGGYTLNNFTINTYNKITAGIRLMAVFKPFKIISVLYGC